VTALTTGWKYFTLRYVDVQFPTPISIFPESFKWTEPGHCRS